MFGYIFFIAVHQFGNPEAYDIEIYFIIMSVRMCTIVICHAGYNSVETMPWVHCRYGNQL